MTLKAQGLKTAIYLTHDFVGQEFMKGLAMSYVISPGISGVGDLLSRCLLHSQCGTRQYSSLSLHMPYHPPGPLQGLGLLTACSVGSHTSYLEVLRDRKWKIPGWLSTGNDTVLLRACSTG